MFTVLVGCKATIRTVAMVCLVVFFFRFGKVRLGLVRLG